MIQVMMKNASTGVFQHEELLADPMLTSSFADWSTNSSSNIHTGHSNSNSNSSSNNSSWDRFEASAIISSPTASLNDDWFSELYNPSAFISSPGWLQLS